MEDTSNNSSFLEKGLQDISVPRARPFPTRSVTWSFPRPQYYIRPASLPTWPLRSNSEVKESRKLRSTAYLDGLRGFAALLVYILHHQVWGHSGMMGEFILENAWGWNGKYYFVCTPFIRVFFSGGHVAVTTFFIISGYVLSHKTMSLLHKGDTARVAESLTSSFFRRWLRLFVPVIATTLIWACSWHVLGIRNHNPGAITPEPTLRAELWRWYNHFKNYSFIFHEDPAFVYNDHTWSIPLEFRGSIVVYTALSAFTQCSKRMRIWCQLVLIVYFLYIVDGWYCALFSMGMLLCDLDLMAATNKLPYAFKRMAPFKQYLAYAALIAGLYLGGVPSITDDAKHLRESPGWYYLSFLKPQAMWDFRWFYRFYASLFIVTAAQHIHFVRKFFETRFCQYLGRISYGFYLVHGPILWSLGDRIYAAVGRVREGHSTDCPRWINRFPFPNAGPFGLEFNFLAAQLILLPVTLWAAEMITITIDETAVKFAQRLFVKTIEKEKDTDDVLKVKSAT